MKSNFRQYGAMENKRWEESERRSQEVRRSEKSKREEDAGALKGRKVTIHCVFPIICGSRGSKSNLAKAAGAEPAGQMRDEKLHAVVVRSTFPSQNVQNTIFSEFLRPRLEVAMPKKCTPFWLEAHVQVKRCKAHHVWTTFGSCDVEKVHAVVARSTFPSQKCQKLRGTGTDHFLTFRSRKSVRRCGAKHISKSNVSKTVGSGPLLNGQMLFWLACTLWKVSKTWGFVAVSTTHYTTLH